MAGQLLKWHAGYYLRGKGFPLVCGCFLTNRCNLQCAMCSIWGDKKKSTLSLEQFRTLVDSTTPGLCYLSLSGGEPLLVDNLMDMVAYASKRVPYVHLVTNGMLMDDAAACELAKAGLSEISVSLDGGREWHNSLRRSPKSFDAAVNAIESVKRAAPGISIVVNSVIFPDRLQEIEKALEITGQLNVAHKVQPVNRHFTFEEISAQPAELAFEDIDRVALEKLVNALAENPRIANSRYFLRRIPDYFGKRLTLPVIKKGCLIPQFYLEVSSYGRVSPCMTSSGWNGSLALDSNLRKNLAGEEYAGAKQKMAACRMCNESMYVCYWEPMIQFPLPHLIKYGLEDTP